MFLSVKTHRHTKQNEFVSGLDYQGSAPFSWFDEVVVTLGASASARAKVKADFALQRGPYSRSTGRLLAK